MLGAEGLPQRLLSTLFPASAAPAGGWGGGAGNLNGKGRPGAGPMAARPPATVSGRASRLLLGGPLPAQPAAAVQKAGDARYCVWAAACEPVCICVCGCWGLPGLLNGGFLSLLPRKQTEAPQLQAASRRKGSVHRNPQHFQEVRWRGGGGDPCLGDQNVCEAWN